MLELASLAVGAVHLICENLADFRFVVLWDVALSLELGLPVGERALVRELTEPSQLPVATYFSFVSLGDCFEGLWHLSSQPILTLLLPLAFLGRRSLNPPHIIRAIRTSRVEGSVTCGVSWLGSL